VLRLLFDQHAGSETYERPSSSDGFDIELLRNVGSLGPRADDTEVWHYAVENDRVVLTNDQHFIDGTADPSDRTHPGVIPYDITTGRRSPKPSIPSSASRL